MQLLIKTALLGLTFVLVFINPDYLGKPVYYGLFPLLFVLVWVFYHISYSVSQKVVRTVCPFPFSYSLFCAMVPLQGDGDLVRGRLVITPANVVLYQRGKTLGSCKEAWSIETRKIRNFTLGKVLSVRNGITFQTDEYQVSFVSAKAKKQKEQIQKALGWDSPRVEGKGSSAPSFSSLTD